MSNKQLQQIEGGRGDAFDSPAAQQVPHSTKRPFPEVRLLEDEASLTVLASLPGFAREDLSITLERGAMTLTGRQRAHVPAGFRAVLRNRASTDFSCQVELGEAVIGFAADARLENGVLTIRLQKRDGSARTLIPVCCA
jgi:HSP20 family molecular chaperone IbpA